ncbi:MAG TPA: hypothetical protein VF867_18685 [Arthrobacter sp.]
MAEQNQATMPAHERAALTAAYKAFRAAVDPHDAWANRRLATVIVSALEAGWSQRALSENLGITRERVTKLARWTSAPRIKVEHYEPGKRFPARLAGVFRRHEDEVNLRRIHTERAFAATVRSAVAAGWPYPRLGALIGVTGERIRQVAEMELSTHGVEVPAFTVYARQAKEPTQPQPAQGVLTAEETAQLRALADTARTATKTIGKRLGPDPTESERLALENSLRARRASEELSALIISAKERKISWSDLDEACGYSPGGARTRATRHGYGKTWPSLTPYTRTSPDIYDKAGLARALSDVPDGA